MWAAPVGFGSAPPPRPAPKRRAWIAPVVVMLVLCAVVIGAIAVVANVDTESTSDDASGRTGADAPATTTPRLTNRELLGQFCSRPEPWREVPPYVAGQPGRAWIDLELDLDSPTEVAEGSRESRGLPPVAGSTVLSPVTDGAVSQDDSVLVRTRAVVCVRANKIVDTGQSCNMELLTQWGTGTGQPITPQLMQTHYTVVVHELHSGGVLHKGEILTAAICPDRATYNTASPPTQVLMPLSDRDVMGWVTSHFVEGKPA